MRIQIVFTDTTSTCTATGYKMLPIFLHFHIGYFHPRGLDAISFCHSLHTHSSISYDPETHHFWVVDLSEVVCKAFKHLVDVSVVFGAGFHKACRQTLLRQLKSDILMLLDLFVSSQLINVLL